MTAAQPALEVIDVHSGYGRTQVLHGVSLSVPQGRVAALLGPNGAGKSTLLKTVCGLLPAARGVIRLVDEDVTGASPTRRSRRGLCYIPEGRGIFRSLTVRENLLLQLPPGRAPADAIQIALDTFPRLGERLKQLAGTLSGGEQQMLALAQAYVGEPSVVLVDEPSFGLAPKLVDLVFESLYAISQRGVSLLVVDQFATRTLELASEAHILRHGELVYSGDAASLLDSDVFDAYFGVGTGSEAR